MNQTLYPWLPNLSYKRTLEKERKKFYCISFQSKQYIKTPKAEKYNKTLDLIKEYENQNKIIVLRPSIDLKISRVEKDLEKLKAIHQLGVDDCNLKLDTIRSYLTQ